MGCGQCAAWRAPASRSASGSGELLVVLGSRGTRGACYLTARSVAYPSQAEVKRLAARHHGPYKRPTYLSAAQRSLGQFLRWMPRLSFPALPLRVCNVSCAIWTTSSSSHDLRGCYKMER
jgi:hypothetical protein